MTRVMGIVNVTPDSFSDGGLWLESDSAIAHAESLIEQGADIIDIGGESTRPGSHPVDEATELERTIPVVSALVSKGVEVSIDTTKAAVARAAVDAGATIINDVSASLENVAASTGAGWIAMHALSDSATMQDDPRYDDVVEDIADFLADAVRRGRAAGVERIWVDPGIGFGKTKQHNLELLANIDRFAQIAPVLVGASRKSVIGQVHAQSDSLLTDGLAGENPMTGSDDRLEGSVGIAVWSAYLGVDMIRVHDVRATVHALSLLKHEG
ncbi:MAG: dihydropteroate synthase [Acidimicrobiaceae bacterium]|nr:dihydropteroate synthase [Acidimicrobiaceae bacterium]MYC41710.1 dihydropteroate synthase [Acidimicrobiaceae bacterium]